LIMIEGYAETMKRPLIPLKKWSKLQR
jgi:hypothetical protein